ncbi:acyl-CoA synthetase (AMP-forming)/AMP-acid ligase II [Catenuloplanes nepalensis]|uniref:Acyl-CoA synthetase (AMP-forming)/AMP-acid ligase II n=1 Tax=Catenuloplanes nepalensis TaxID=587533 RepID=A0ABT9MSF8_9ACTN|nr:class I adenylate-forming enzyme family protein [Catenuloplanes nepalensis]MDP9794193.1 acyl-CoA synthetase (AMP-forming)/AMP-acid ligase II [Catenuloplanes nepalensis]
MTTAGIITAGVPERAAVLSFLGSAVDADPAAAARGGTAAAGAPADVVDAIAGLGLPPGALVLIAMPNGRLTLAAFFGTLLAGAVPVLVPPGAGAARITEISRAFGGAALIAPRIDPARYGATTVHPLGDRCEAVLLGDAGEPRYRYQPGEVVMMTSGTSGITSGCLHGIDAMLRNAGRHATSIGQRAGDTVLVSLPLYYSYGLVAQALAAFVRGSRLVVSGPPFTPASFAGTVRAHDVTVSSLTPSGAARLAAEPPADPAGLRVLTVGGDALDRAHVRTLLTAGPQRELYLTYGLTEAGPRVTTLAAHREPEHRWTSVGTPLPGVRTHLREPIGDGPGAELVVESDTVMRRRLPGSAPAVPGTVATGDRFDIDDDGYHFFRGRTADSVIVGGEKVWLPSVRRLAGEVPGVRHARTTVYRDDRDELRYSLDVTVDDPGPRTAAEIERALNRVLLRAERPHRITLCQAPTEEWRK